MDDRCIDCHDSDAPSLEEFRANLKGYKEKSIGPRLATYKDLIVFVKGEDFGALMRRLDDGENTDDGKPGSMYKYLGDTDEQRAENLNLFKKWIGNWTMEHHQKVIDDVKNDWFQSILDGKTPENKTVEERIKEITDSIKALEK